MHNYMHNYDAVYICTYTSSTPVNHPEPSYYTTWGWTHIFPRPLRGLNGDEARYLVAHLF